MVLWRKGLLPPEGDNSTIYGIFEARSFWYIEKWIASDNTLGWFFSGWCRRSRVFRSPRINVPRCTIRRGHTTFPTDSSADSFDVWASWHLFESAIFLVMRMIPYQSSPYGVSMRVLLNEANKWWEFPFFSFCLSLNTQLVQIIEESLFRFRTLL